MSNKLMYQKESEVKNYNIFLAQNEEAGELCCVVLVSLGWMAGWLVGWFTDSRDIPFMCNFFSFCLFLHFTAPKNNMYEWAKTN